MELKVSSLAERPEMFGPVVRMDNSWPEFVKHDPVGDAHYGRIAAELPEYVLFAADERDQVLAHAYSVPFVLAAEGRGALPARGWDQVLGWAFEDLRGSARPDTVSAIAIDSNPTLTLTRCIRAPALASNICNGDRPRAPPRRY